MRSRYLHSQSHVRPRIAPTITKSTETPAKCDAYLGEDAPSRTSNESIFCRLGPALCSLIRCLETRGYRRS
jgi:hypothetical protein